MTGHVRTAAAVCLGALTLSTVTATAATAATAAPAKHHPAPSFARTSVRCVVTDHETIPGLGSVPIYSPTLSWKVAHATGMALSVDDPGVVGSYGTYGPTGSLTLGGGCYKGEKTTITFYTVGGHGHRAHKTYVLKGKKVRPTPPPFA